MKLWVEKSRRGYSFACQQERNIRKFDSVLDHTYSYLSERIEANSLCYSDEFTSSFTSITSNGLHQLDDEEEQANQTIRSSIDNLSLNSSLTFSSVHFFDQEQINETNTDDEDEDEEYDIIIEQQTPMLQDHLNHCRNHLNVQTPSYDFIQSNSSNQIVSPLFKTNNSISDQNDLTSKWQAMDEKECTLQIVNGAVTLVPKKDEQSEDEEEEEQQNSVEYETSQNYDSPEQDKHSSSLESSISTPSISEHEREPSFSTSTREQSQEPFVLLRDLPSPKSPPPSSLQTEQNVDLLDLFSTPPVPRSTSQTNNESQKTSSKNLLDDSLSSISFEEPNAASHSDSESKSREAKQSKQSSPSASIKDEASLSTSNQLDDLHYPLPKPEPPPVAKPLNKARINEFASLLSSAVHLSKPNQPSPRPPEREPSQTIPPSESEETKKHIDARYTEKIDDRKNLQVDTSNIKALFEQKISDTVKALAQSNEHLAHVQENKQLAKKPPTSYAYVNRQQTQPIITRRQSLQDSPNMSKYQETKDIVIEEKQPEQQRGHQTQLYSSRRNNSEQIPSSSDGYYSESLIAREIRETKEKEEELRQQRKKCGLPENVSSLLPPHDPRKPNNSSKPPVKSSSFLSNLGFFTSKSTEPSHSSPRRSTTSIQNLVYDSSSNDEQAKPPPFIPESSHVSMKRASSNQILPSAQAKTNFIQQEIEAIRAKESELRQLGRIQHTSDEHSDPRKYQELVPTIPKSQSTGRIRKETERFNAPILPSTNGLLKPKTANSSSSLASARGRFPSPSPTAPIVTSASKAVDYSKLSSADRLDLEKREMQERELELRKQRHSLTGNISIGNSTLNGDSGNVSQDEHDDEHERYFDKIQRLKRTENEKAQAPLQRPIKKSNLSQKWEQMMASKANSNVSDEQN